MRKPIFRIMLQPCAHGVCRTLELQPAVLTALAKMALGEAQALTAHRGEVRGMAPLTVSALHVASMGE
jgi:hypothetical protein